MMDKIILTSAEPSLHSRVLNPQRTRMRGISAMVFLALCALLIIVYQAIQQELNIRNLKTRIVVSGEQVKLKEDGIMSTKTKVEDINKKLSALTTQRDQLKKQKDDIKKSTAESEKELGTCNAEKGTLEKKSNEAKDALKKLKEDQEAEKKKAEEEIQGLKKSILERDVKICKFVDVTAEEAKKLCAVAL
ncbi:myosin heavy chain, muscle [Megalobrama amblycephala]|uniref:myosin heavy chain, muscle n=1 Tax=Megalobrama amblycephala TaxID=75352 RepID=UPI002013FCF8|nr:myosin heavy chain, muscle [Megalobrama amblycephala]